MHSQYVYTASADNDEVMADERHTTFWYDMTHSELERVVATGSFYLRVIMLYVSSQFVNSWCPVSSLAWLLLDNTH